MKESESGTKAKTAAQFAMSFALVCLAGSIVYFTYEFMSIARYIPGVLQTVDQTVDKIDPIMDEVGEIRQLIPDILKEVEETRKQIPPILEQVEQTREQIPPILKEVEAIRKELPAVLKSADKASDAVVVISKQVEETRPLIPKVLKEVETTRESIPPLMDRADQMIDKARVAGQEAGAGAVTGLFKGIITTPFALVGDAGKSIMGSVEADLTKYTEKDIALLEAALLDLLNNGKRGDARQWNNPESKSHGTLKLTRIYPDDEHENRECRTVQSKSFDTEGALRDVSRSFCKNEEGKWYKKDKEEKEEKEDTLEFDEEY